MAKKIILKAVLPIPDAYKGSRITSVAQVINLAKKGKAIYYRGCRTTAAFVQNFQARHLQNEIDASVLFNYIPKSKH